MLALTAAGCDPVAASAPAAPQAPLTQAAQRLNCEGSEVSGSCEFYQVAEAEADTYVKIGSQREQDKNYGHEASFAVSGWYYTYGYLRFNLGNLPAGVQVHSVKLSATAFKGYSQNGDGNVYAYLVPNNSWNEYYLTWNYRPWEVGDPLGSWFLWYPVGDRTEDKVGVNADPSLIPVVQNAANATDRRISFLLRINGAYNTTYYSREEAVASRRPKLQVGYVWPALTSEDAWASASPAPLALTKQSATLLADGRVLVAGGADSVGWTASAAVYSPATRTWASTASMFVKRYGHGATLLSSGEVLVTGGEISNVPTATTERYSATTGTWSAAAAMSQPRFRHTVTVLNDGRLLVAGGFDGTTGIATTEFYAPSSGTWTPGPSMSTRRFGHTATLLPDGRVLVAGGHTGGQALATAELYDPATNTWSATGTMSSSHHGHAAALLPDGRVLVASGLTPGGLPTPISELYNPATGTWAATGSLTTARSEFTLAMLPSGRVLVLGGISGSGAVTSTVESYDVTTGTWTQAPVMGTARRNLSATVLPEGRILVVGGQQDGTTVPLSSAELFTPAGGP
ncbi:kelch repeat-containing protein [Hyalangium minutum]|uniref:Kelch domain protein n=1 Tax=Hyalangium minutum TaxID=394096 RepID=A0A085WUE8_9BACT|nr:kelch repeat-containing protein [Hyalangium minutum]KFE71311.1 kelch domain protein [Hyalangium minutum]